MVNAALDYALVASWQAYQFSSESIPRTDVHPAVAKAARLMTRADSSIGLNALAMEAGLSPARLSRLFKQQTGISLTAFRQRKCLERFLRLYRTGARYTLIEAALLSLPLQGIQRGVAALSERLSRQYFALLPVAQTVGVQPAPPELRGAAA